MNILNRFLAAWSAFCYQWVEAPSYHDVVVHFGEQSIRLCDASYGLRLTCTRAGGWDLWNVWRGDEKLLGSEYGDEPFCIEVRGVAVCGVLPDRVKALAKKHNTAQ